MADPLPIVVLGASFSGISVVHHLMSNAVPELSASQKFSYKIILVSPSTHIYWNISAPRALVSDKLIPHEESFQPISKAFKKWDPAIFQYIEGTAVDLDTKARVVTIAPSSSRNEGRSGPTIAEKVGNAFSAAAQNVTGSDLLQEVRNPTAWGPFDNPAEETFTINYHAIVIATGSTAHSPLLSLRGPHTNTLQALEEFHRRLPTADTVVIAGGGPSGVETAGQVSYWYNLPYGPVLPKNFAGEVLSGVFGLGSQTQFRPYAKRVILLSGASRLLPQLDAAVGQKALQQLSGLGVKVILDTRVMGASVSKEGKTTLRLSNDESILCDLYIPCTGVSPNTQFLPSDSPLLRNGCMATVHSPTTLRVEVPPELAPTDDILPAEGDAPPPFRRLSEGDVNQNARVYAIGDCAAYSSNCIMDIYAAMPVLMNNMVNDLLAFQKFIENPYGGNKDEIEHLSRQDYEYRKDPRDSQVVPIGYMKPGGVGVVYGHKLPSFFVYAAKGRKYKIDAASAVIEQGLSPY